LVRGALIVLASAAPNAFPLSQMGYGSLHDLALQMILPAAVALGIAWVALMWTGPRWLAALLVRGAIAGALATLALEAVRYPGFRMGFMPGNLPRLMGVLLLDRFALGPSVLSDAAGFAYHAWNGAAFGIVFVMLAKGRSSWWAVPFGVAVGIGFLASPVVEALGVGPFGRDFGWRFAATVLTAHVAFGAALAVLARGPLGRVGLSPVGGERPGHLRTSSHQLRASARERVPS
jgi:hypothetical protein